MSQQGRQPGKTLADHYVSVALKLIELADKGGHLSSPEQLREWWRKERSHRDEYDLNDNHEAVLIRACADKVRELEDQANDNSDRNSTRSASGKRRVAI
jgi:hypothetical protein